MLNKKGLFGGGLCLVNTAVIAISTPSVVVAEGIGDVRNQLNQIWWRINANNEIQNSKLKKSMLGSKIADITTQSST